MTPATMPVVTTPKQGMTASAIDTTLTNETTTDNAPSDNLM